MTLSREKSGEAGVADVSTVPSCGDMLDQGLSGPQLPLLALPTPQALTSRRRRCM